MIITSRITSSIAIQVGNSAFITSSSLKQNYVRFLTKLTTVSLTDIFVYFKADPSSSFWSIPIGQRPRAAIMDFSKGRKRNGLCNLSPKLLKSSSSKRSSCTDFFSFSVLLFEDFLQQTIKKDAMDCTITVCKLCIFQFQLLSTYSYR